MRRWLVVLAVSLTACGGGDAGDVELRWEYPALGGGTVELVGGEAGTPVPRGTPYQTDVYLEGALQDGSPIEVLWTPEPAPLFYSQAITFTQCFQIEEALTRLDEEWDALPTDAARAVALVTAQALVDFGEESDCGLEAPDL